MVKAAFAEDGILTAAQAKVAVDNLAASSTNFTPVKRGMAVGAVKFIGIAAIATAVVLGGLLAASVIPAAYGVITGVGIAISALTGLFATRIAHRLEATLDYYSKLSNTVEGNPILKEKLVEKLAGKTFKEANQELHNLIPDKNRIKPWTERCTEPSNATNIQR